MHSKKWAWNGCLTISPTGCAERQTVCEKATVTDCTEPTEPGKPELKSFVGSKDLNLPKLYDLADLDIFLPACRPAQQFGRLTAEGSDEESLNVLIQYMTRQQQVGHLLAQ